MCDSRISLSNGRHTQSAMGHCGTPTGVLVGRGNGLQALCQCTRVCSALTAPDSDLSEFEEFSCSFNFIIADFVYLDFGLHLPEKMAYC